jgi:hypothetical protein
LRAGRVEKDHVCPLVAGGNLERDGGVQRRRQELIDARTIPIVNTGHSRRIFPD